MRPCRSPAPIRPGSASRCSRSATSTIEGGELAPGQVANPTVGQTRGGIHAAPIDFAANLALMNNAHLGRPVLTNRSPGRSIRLATRARPHRQGTAVVRRSGRQMSTCEAEDIHRDEAGRLCSPAAGAASWPRAGIQAALGRNGRERWACADVARKCAGNKLILFVSEAQLPSSPV